MKLANAFVDSNPILHYDLTMNALIKVTTDYFNRESEILIREMKAGEEHRIRQLAAKLHHEDQTIWRKQTKPLDSYLSEWEYVPILSQIKGKNVFLVAEQDGAVVGLCWCTIVDRGADKQGEVNEFYVEPEQRNSGVGRHLIMAARQLFLQEGVEVAFVWTHHGHKAAVTLYEEASFKEVDQLVMAFVP